MKTLTTNGSWRLSVLAGCASVAMAWSCGSESSRAPAQDGPAPTTGGARRLVFHTGILLDVDAVPADSVQLTRVPSEGPLDSGHTTVHIRVDGRTIELSDEGLPNGQLRVNGELLLGQAFRVDSRGAVTTYDASGEPDLLGLEEVPED